MTFKEFVFKLVRQQADMICLLDAYLHTKEYSINDCLPGFDRFEGNN